MAAHSKARLFVLKKGNGADPTEVFTAVAGLTNLKFDGQTGVDDITVKEDNQWSASAAGRMSATVTADGRCRDFADFAQLNADWVAQDESNYQIVHVTDGFGWQGPYLITALSAEGGTDGAVSFSVTLTAMGELTALPTTP